MEILTLMPSKLGRLRELTDQLLSEEQMIVTFFQLCPDMLSVISSEGTILQINDAWSEFLHWSEEQLVSEYLVSFVHRDDINGVQRILKSLKKLEKTTFHCRFRAESGDFIPLEWSVILAADGNIYASARVIPPECLECERAQQKLHT